jgi:ATP-binding cassette subfamily C protein CydC
LALFLGLVATLASVSLLSVSGWFISAAAVAGLSGTAALGFDYFRPAAMIRLAAITRTAGRYAERLASHHAALSLLQALRHRVFVRLSRRPVSATEKLSSSQALHTLTSDVDVLDQFPLTLVLPWLWAIVLSALVLLFYALVLPAMAMMAAPVLMMTLLLPAAGSIAAVRLAREEAGLAASRREALVVPLGAMTSLLLWQQWDEVQRRFAQLDHEVYRWQLKSRWLARVLALGQHMGIAALSALVLWQGGLAVHAGQLSVPWLLASVLVLFGLSEVLMSLSRDVSSLGNALIARDRINLLSSADGERGSGLPFPQDPVRLEIRGLCARHEGALTGPDNVSVQLHPGEVLCVEGPSGSGKSTLLHVLAGELAPRSGEVLLNGLNMIMPSIPSTTLGTGDHPTPPFGLRRTSRPSTIDETAAPSRSRLMSEAATIDHRSSTIDQVGFLAQQVDLFDLSLAENLRFGNPAATEGDLWNVLDHVGLRDWGMAQPARLDTALGEYGTAVSAGQARRIALARLLLKPRSVLLLDEPFAGVDDATRDRVWRNLREYQKHGLLVVVSHQRLPLDPGIRRVNVGLGNPA